MDDDFRRISEWAEIFEEPAKLSETVAKNWLLHKRAIRKDIDKEKKDWDNGNYFSAGADTADALVKLIGPVPANAVGLPATAIPDFIAGLIYGFTGDNDLEEIEACYSGG